MRRKAKYLKESPEDKQIRMVLISMVVSICLCMSCLVGVTWAWYETTITSEDNVITVGKLEVAVALIRGDQADRENIDPSGKYTYKLEDVGTYSITLINSGSIPGFCTIKLTDDLGNVESFSTGTLNPAGQGQEDTATIELTVTPEDIVNDILPVKLEITPYWGEDPAYTIAMEDEDVFIPTEDTTEETTEETTEATEETDATAEPSTEATEPSVATEPTEAATEPDATTQTTEAVTEPDSTDSTEETVDTTETTESK